jgi:putative flippase GtrA
MPHSDHTRVQAPFNPWVKFLQLTPQLRGFVFAGLVGTLIDYGFYHLYDNWLPPLFSKGLAFSSATLFVYFMNKFWTFKQPLHSRREIVAFFALYTVSMLLNTGVNSFCLYALPMAYHDWTLSHPIMGNNYLLALTALLPHTKLLAFLMATASSTVLNFMGQKFWVFELKKKQVAKQASHNRLSN